MYYVFLDVDGVLNNNSTKDLIGRYLGLDDKNLAVLKRLMDKIYEEKGRENVSLILSSSWRIGISQHEFMANPDELQTALKRKLKELDLVIDDITPHFCDYRGLEISTYLSDKEVDGYVVLDDDLFYDFKEFKTTAHLVRTSFMYGLQDKHIEKALELINKPLTEQEQKRLKEIKGRNILFNRLYGKGEKR